MSFDATHGVLYVQHNNNVDAYNSDGTLIEEFATGLTTANFEFRGMAVDESTGTVYVSSGLPAQVVALPGAIVPDEEHRRSNRKHFRQRPRRSGRRAGDRPSEVRSS